MSSFSIGELARRFQLSRSTLLHYERSGLLRPSARSESNYRRYSGADVARLQRIRDLRALGLTLTEIAPLLDGQPQGIEAALRQRFDQLGADIAQCRQQQQQILQLLRGCQKQPAGAMDKAAWTALMRASGMDEHAMWRWHAEFEQRAPDAHRQFLQSLGVDDQELARIRQWSRDFDD